MKDFIRRSFQGICLSMLIFAVMGAIYSPSPVYLKLLISWSLIGCVCGGGSLLYQVDTLSPILAGACHLTLSLLTFLGLAAWNQWFPLTWGIILSASLQFSFIFILIALAYYLYYKKQIKAINRKLKQE
ncbi:MULTISPECIES: DUF3021 domain-containing protein [Aerococcus]|uniref:DUF3021 domain-containing protein n=1 Tax=Aerococcus sanguinicola TaxID=119206 RepID=A0A5N1GKM4_9LACT|nr:MULTISPECIES: DUF3021 domain-containing protein [Aerococcus]KAA9300561.1 DUF3021 domain-containing protein [Aerococcus sanguinicola]MDK6369641.1 DUF3021 domain-containing protein [Aerococcus sp. UMB9870]MDK6680146.1 DUF3021 domain-containing protein [Aerococcus sp. UMB8608]MDK6686307.1 DUF3021 domain-containing protein [Aerococcus sp. UMB8623]MDK6940227.1 DUF3021 domain-containing protein [Aerococcus sp. UMB8487]